MWISHVEKWRKSYVNVENVEEMWTTYVEKWRENYVNVNLWRECG